MIPVGARKAVLDFSHLIDEDDIEIVPLKDEPRFQNGKPKKLNGKAIRNRARRDARRKYKGKDAMQIHAELLHKPIEEWDVEELARGRPRAADGSWRGRKPDWIPRALHEQAMDQFRQFVREGMNVHTIKALQTIERILDDDERDEKGKPIVPPSTKLDATKFLIEHVIGKPKVEIKQDISVKLQGILAQAVVPIDAGADDNVLELAPGDSWEGDEDDDG